VPLPVFDARLERMYNPAPMANLKNVVQLLEQERRRLMTQVQKIEAAVYALDSMSMGRSGRKRRTMSAAARRKIGAAQRARWAKVKKAK
jgi:hypothetical protein